MAYIIGNTTVIDNNGALGSVAGNSLNLANNPNISGGGGVKSLTSSSNFSDSELGSTGAIAVCIGGGGGGATNNDYSDRAGGAGGVVIHAFPLSASTSITATVGAAGNNGTANAAGGSGGSSYIGYPTVQSHNAGGGQGAGQNYNGADGAGVNGDSTNIGFNNIGKGSPRPPFSGPGNPSPVGTGYIGILGL